jgi:hypothetical protein
LVKLKVFTPPLGGGRVGIFTAEGSFYSDVKFMMNSFANGEKNIPKINQKALKTG